MQCNNCQEFGHTKVRCTQPIKDDEGFGRAHRADEPAVNAVGHSDSHDAGWGTGNADGGQYVDATYDAGGCVRR